MVAADRGTLEPMLLPPVLLVLQAPTPAPPPPDPVPPARLEITTPFPVHLGTDDPAQPAYSLRYDMRVSPVQATPSRLVFTDPSTPLLSLELRARDGQPFRILEAAIQGSGFQLLDPPGPATPRQVLRIRRTGFVPEAMLVLRCTNMDGPLNVPLRFLDPKARPAPAPNASTPSP